MGDAGADPGLTAALTLSDGRVLDPPRALDEGLARLRRAQRALSRKFEALKARQAEGRDPVRLPRPNRFRCQIAEVGRAHTRVVNVRDHWHKVNARRVANAYDRVAYETHGLMFMIRNRKLARVASDRALAKQRHALASALGPLADPGPEPARGDRCEQPDLRLRRLRPEDAAGPVA